MENAMQLNPIGIVHAKDGEFAIEVQKSYRKGLQNIEGFSHLQVLWWGNLYDSDEYRSFLLGDKPYKNGPEKLGVFATRSPVRPNPVLITNVYVLSIDQQTGIITLPYIDAEDGTPVLDIKPYHLSERVRDCKVPEWCSHWPAWDEETATFAWHDEFNF